jgi:hypothetical protein
VVFPGDINIFLVASKDKSSSSPIYFYSDATKSSFNVLAGV